MIIGLSGDEKSKRSNSNQVPLVCSSIPRHATNIAFDPSRVHNVPGEYEKNIKKCDECSQENIGEAAKKGLAGHNG